eukprot:m51a1_g1621 putative 7-dehydrocholesterol reductase (1557) ;mRNA; r:231026-240684
MKHRQTQDSQAPEAAGTPRRASETRGSSGAQPTWGRSGLASLASVLGVSALLLTTPLTVVYFWASCRHHGGSLLWPVGVWEQGGWDAFVQQLPRWDTEAALIWVGWVAAQAVLYLACPGPVGYGQETPTGLKLSYNVNGWRVYLLSHAVFLLCSLHFHWFPATIIYDKWGGLLVAANLWGYFLAVFAYVKAHLWPTHPGDCKFTGNAAYDFFMGIEFNPRIGNLDFKLFFNGRPGIVAWTLIDISFMAAQYGKYGRVSNSMVLVAVLHLYYVADFFWNEDWYLRTLDIALDHFGYMLAWGDSVWLPWMYTLQAAYLVANPVELSWPAFAAILALGTSGYLLFRAVNAQKDEFRRSQGKALVWGKPARFIETKYVTADGKVHQTKLLTSGFWGLSRHFNYIGDLMISLAMCLPCGFQHPLPYFYAVFMTILLVHRTYRDGSRCKAKYGADWDRYCQAVPENSATRESIAALRTELALLSDAPKRLEELQESYVRAARNALALRSASATERALSSIIDCVAALPPHLPTSDSDRYQTCFVECKGPQVVLDALNAYPESPEVLERALCVVPYCYHCCSKKMAKETASSVAKLLGPLVTAITATSKRYSQRCGLQCAACRAIATPHTPNTCAFAWSLAPGGRNGTVVARVRAGLSARASLYAAADGLPGGARLEACAPSGQRAAVDVLSISDEGARAHVLDGLERTMGAALCDAVRELAESSDVGATASVRAAAEAVRTQLVPQEPPEPEPVEGDEWVRLDSNGLVRAAEYLVNDVVGTGIVNDVMLAATNGTGAAVEDLRGNQAAQAMLSGWGKILSAFFAYGTSTLDVAGAGTWETLDVLRPDREGNDSYTLVNRIGLREFSANVTFNTSTTSRGCTMDQHVRVRIRMSHPWALFRLRALVNGTLLASYTTPMLLNATCLLKAIPFPFYPPPLSVTQAYLNGTSAGADAFEITTEFPSWASDDIDSDLAPFVDALGVAFSDAFAPVAPELASAVWLSRVVEALNDGIQSFLLLKYSDQCDAQPEPPSSAKPAVDKAATIAVFSACGALALAICVAAAATRRRYAAGPVVALGGSGALPPLDTSSVSPQLESSPLIQAPGGKQQGSSEPPLVSHPGLSAVARYLMPLLLLANIALFVSSNRGVGASVYPVVKLGTAYSKHMDSMFDFGLVNTIRDMWTAGVYPISLLVAVFSGLWPYIKLVAMLVCWCIPPALLTVRRRELILMALDALGKWSMVDAYVMTLMLVAFRFGFPIPAREGQPETGGSIDLFVSARFGFTSFLVATISSLVLGHVIVAVHRHVETRAARLEVARRRGVDVASLESDAECVRPVPLRAMAFSRSSRYRGVGQAGVVALLAVSLALVLYGIIVESVEFRIGGAAGLALKLGGQDPIRRYSMLGMGTQVPASCEEPNGFTARLIEVSFFATAVAVPVVHLVVLLFLWLVPLSLVAQRATFVVAEVLNAWCAIEVYIISIIAALLEIRQFAAFMVGGRCELVNPVLAQLLDIPLEGNDICFEVKAEVLPGSWVLLGACVLYITATAIVMRRCHKALHDREPYNRVN